MRFAEREWVIAAERDALNAEEFDKKAQRVGVVDEGVDVEMRGSSIVREIKARICVVIGGAQIGADVKAVLDPADGEWKRAAAMGEGDAKFGEAREDAAENHRTNGERRFGRHPDEPW